MKAPPFPPDEKQRLQALCDLQILDTGPEERFDRFTRVARALFDVPMAIISLVDAERQWFKSRQGLEASETPRDISFCGHAILEDAVFNIPDALADERFADNPLVTGPLQIRFYAGAPLVASNDSRVGTLCILDTRPRQLTESQLDGLQDLANCVADELNEVKLRETLRELAEQRRYTEDILNSVSEGIVAIDDAGIVRAFNPAAERIFGYAADDIIGRDFTHLMTETDARELARHLRLYVAEGDARAIGIRREVEGLRSDGSSFPVGLTIGKTEIAGKLMFNGLVRDISARKKLDRMKNEFISTVSHELRTPLTSIMGSLGLIRGGAFGEISDEIRSMLDIAHASSDRLVRLVNDMLDLERIESGKAALRTVPTDLNAVAETAIAELAGFRREYRVNTDFHGTGDAALVLGDPDQLSRVVTNLLSNAIKFSPPDGRVRITLARDNGQFRLSVADQGPGIPGAFQNEIFKRFSQADTSDSRATHGTGLGLSIAKAIIDQHAGEIGFDTEPGEGTTFHFQLPAWQAAKDSAAPADVPAGHVLILEDDPDVAKLLALILRNSGLTADLAPTVAEARERLATTAYDAMTLDLCLPDGDGIALIHELRRNDGTCRLPIVVVSANIGTTAGQLDGAAMGIVDWIPKPVDLDRVLGGIGKAIRGRRGAPAAILHVEHDPAIRRTVADLLEDKVELVAAPTVEAGKSLLTQRDFDLVILDLVLGDESGESLLPHLQRADGSPIPVVIFSGEPPSADLASRVTASLVKSQTSRERLAGTILALLERAPEPLPRKRTSGAEPAA